MSTAAFQVDAAAAAATMVVDVISEHQIEQQPSPAVANLKLARSLFAVGSLTLVADASTVLYQPPKGPVFANHGAAYYGILAAVLALEMATACRLSRSGSSHGHGRRFLAFARGLLCFAGLLLLLVLAVGGFALTAVKAP
ncbi:hypothetical protein BRADI_2g03030v3 [Brachypodium distachyon]|uniref:Uncharacterized protein n=1 Tax=Brachypodium distachyon TaxID=15368 RepID=A0A0Q3FTU8_BRADI|nr:hypothetical protein BRADI_2g03030v3 [Brachypodium distachyon]